MSWEFGVYTIDVPDPELRSQLVPDRRDKSVLKLLYAILDDALRVIDVGWDRRDEEFHDAMKWVRSDDQTLFSFRAICDYFNLDYVAIRRVIINHDFRMSLHRPAIGRRIVRMPYTPKRHRHANAAARYGA